MLRIPLLLSGLLYFGVAGLVRFLFTLDGPDTEFDRTILTMLMAMSITLGLAAIGLGCICHWQAKWVYYCCFATTVLYVPSAFFFLGIPMLIFLLKRDVQHHYGVSWGSQPRPSE